MCEIIPSHVLRHLLPDLMFLMFYLIDGDTLNTTKLAVVLKCFKDLPSFKFYI